MSRHVIVGKGPIGRTLSEHLAAQGHDVLVLSRSGAPAGASGAWHGAVAHAAVDASDAAALARHARGSDALYNAINPPYHRWPLDWPPVASALLDAASATGAVLVTAGNLYGYGRGTHLMTEESALASTETKGRVRAEMWHEMLRRHERGDVRVTEVRGSDYLGPYAEAHAHAGPRMLEPLLAGRSVRPVGSADVPHSWTYLPDFARSLAAAAIRPEAWGCPWHVPSPGPLTFRELATRFAQAAGAPTPRIRAVPLAAVRAVGLVQPMMREVHAVGYQLVEPFVMESEASRRVLGVEPTAWTDVVAQTLAAWRGERAMARPSPHAVVPGRSPADATLDSAVHRPQE